MAATQVICVRRLIASKLPSRYNPARLMMTLFSPLTLFWTLVVGGVTVVALSRARFPLVNGIAAASAVLAAIVWLILGSRLPLQIRVSNWPAGAQLPPWNWRVDEIAWQLTGTLLLILISVLLAGRWAGQGSRREEDRSSPTRPSVAASALLLSAATLTALWADSLVALMAAWTLLGLMLGIAASVDHEQPGMTITQSVAGVGWLLLSLFFLWLAATTAATGAASDFVSSDWPVTAKSSLLTAALLQMGVWPFLGWRRMARSDPYQTRLLMLVVPPLAGASLLIRLAAVNDFSAGYSLFLTAFSLVGLLLGAYRAWLYLDTPFRQLAALAMAQAGVLLLSGVWAGSEALLAETKAVLLALATLAIYFDHQPSSFSWWQQVPAGIALASLAGLPLTAGFSGRITLYSRLLADGRIVLLIVMALIQLSMLMAIASLVWHGRSAHQAPAAGTAGDSKMGQWRWLAGLTLLSVASLSAAGLSQSPFPFIVLLAILIPPLAGLLLLRVVEDKIAVSDTLRQAFPLGAASNMFRRWAQIGLRQIGAVVQDATAILEGEGGMLWLLLVVILFLLIR
jgi:hypothetical protein